MTFIDTFEQWPRCTPARAVVAGAGFGVLGGAVVDSLSLLGDEGFSLAGALFYGGLFGGPFGVIAGGLTGAVASALATALTRAGPLPARVALALTSGVLIGLTGWLTRPAQAWASPAVLTTAVGASAATTGWAVAPWCLAPTTQPDASPTR